MPRDFVCLHFQIDTAILGSTLKEAVVKIFENMEKKHWPKQLLELISYEYFLLGLSKYGIVKRCTLIVWL